MQQVTHSTYSLVNKPHSVNKYLCEYKMQKKIWNATTQADITDLNIRASLPPISLPVSMDVLAV